MDSERKKAEQETDQQTGLGGVIWRGGLDRSTGRPFYQISRKNCVDVSGALGFYLERSRRPVCTTVVGGF